MKFLNRPKTQPLHIQLFLIFFIITTVVLAIAAGYYHQRWQNQLRRTTRLQQQIDVLRGTGDEVLKVDPTATTK